MKWQRWWFVFLVGFSCSLSTGCDRGPAKTRVAFVSNNAAQFWTIAEAGCRKAEKEFDVEVVFRKPGQGDPAAQKEIIDSIVNQGIKAIAVSVIDPANQKDYLDEIAAKVPLITQDNDAPASKRLCYIGTNNYEAGRAVGKLIKETMPTGGTIAIFVGQLEPLNARQRRQGVLDELADKPPLENINQFEMSKDQAKYGEYRLHKTYTDQPVGQQRAKENATAALTELAKEPNVCLIGLWAYNPPMILAAVKDQDKEGKVHIVGFDEDDDTLQGIIDGHIHGTVVQDPYSFGYESVKMMAALAKGDKSSIPSGGIKFVPHRVITKDGSDDRLAASKFWADLKAILNQ